MTDNNEERVYNIQVTKRQLEVLSQTCDAYMRLICGQPMDLQNLMEDAWEKHCKKATGDRFDKEWQGGWYNARKNAEKISNEIRDKFWFCGPSSWYGLGYDEMADILFDIHQVLRHQLFLDKTPEEKENLKWTVSADTPIAFSKEPLVKVTRIKSEE